jgi:hypothetical protein
MLECFLDRDDHNRRRFFSVNGEPAPEICILGNLCAPIHPIGLIHSGHEKNQRDTRVLSKVLEAIDPIVTATVRYEQCPTVFCYLNKAGLIALGRAVQTLSAASRKYQKWRSGDKSAANLIDMVNRFLGDALARLSVERPETIGACYNAALEISHCNLLPI